MPSKLTVVLLEVEALPPPPPPPHPAKNIEVRTTKSVMMVFKIVPQEIFYSWMISIINGKKDLNLEISRISTLSCHLQASKN
jgi:hypothetical protein